MQNQAINTKRQTIHINREENAETPSEWCDGHVAKLYTWHPNYSIGEDTSDIRTEEGHLEGLKSYIQDSLTEGQSIEEVMFWPVYLYDHSGQCLYLHENFVDRRWDGSHIGWLVINPYSQEAEGMTHELLEEAARDTFDMWDAYVREDVYSVSDEEGGWTICYGDSDAEEAVIQQTHYEVMLHMEEKRKFSKEENKALFNLLKNRDTRALYREYAESLGVDMPSYEGDAAEYLAPF